jgi:(5-formylfuran-3-yl)methyl phosphate synthase
VQQHKKVDAVTRMLASVTDANEADIVLSLGADIVDLKDASRGSLGAVSLETAQTAIALVARRCETSATLGDPPYDEAELLSRARGLVAAGVDTLKLAVDRTTLAQLGPALRRLAAEVALVGMMFADQDPDFALLAELAALGFRGAMLDTRDKSRGRLLSHLDPARLEEFCRSCREAALMSGLAGSLESPDVPRLLLLHPDVLGFRTALCRRHDRVAAIDPQAVSLIRDLIPRERPVHEPSPKIDWRLMARGIIGGRDRDGEIDRVFVRDFAVMADIGAYDYERGVLQRVVLDVEAEVRRPGSHADDMRAIFSYDLIIDAIRLVVGRGHVDFVETLAEEVSAIVLQNARVRSVRINARKLDVIDGSVGVEIRRERAGSAAEARPASVKTPGKD